VRLNIEDDKELESVISRLAQKNDVSRIFDEVKNTKVVFRILNDYNFSDANSGDLSKINDDIGRTHGYKISIMKNFAPLIGEGEYYMNISYESDLYTNSNEPEKFQEDYRDVVYRRDDGIYQADQYFKEENILKIIIAKMESQDAFYWKVGGGFHEINADDIERGILISGLSQQTWQHEFLNRNGPARREYNNLSQENVSDIQGMIEGEVGKDITLYSGQNNRVFARGGLTARVTGIKNGSYIGGYLKVGHDWDDQVTGHMAYRVMTGTEVKKYSDSLYNEYFFEFGVHGENIGANIRYVIPTTKDANYLNALPENFENRENLIPPNEPMIWLFLEGKF
jgi:hypothetical protein